MPPEDSGATAACEASHRGLALVPYAPPRGMDTAETSNPYLVDFGLGLESVQSDAEMDLDTLNAPQLRLLQQLQQLDDHQLQRLGQCQCTDACTCGVCQELDIDTGIPGLGFMRRMIHGGQKKGILPYFNFFNPFKRIKDEQANDYAQRGYEDAESSGERLVGRETRSKQQMATDFYKWIKTGFNGAETEAKMKDDTCTVHPEEMSWRGMLGFGKARMGHCSYEYLLASGIKDNIREWTVAKILHDPTKFKSVSKWWKQAQLNTQKWDPKKFKLHQKTTVTFVCDSDYLRQQPDPESKFLADCDGCTWLPFDNSEQAPFEQLNERSKDMRKAARRKFLQDVNSRNRNEGPIRRNPPPGAGGGHPPGPHQGFHPGSPLQWSNGGGLCTYHDEVVYKNSQGVYSVHRDGDWYILNNFHETLLDPAGGGNSLYQSHKSIYDDHGHQMYGGAYGSQRSWANT